MDTDIHVKEGDVLVTKDGSIGKLAHVDALPGPACLNSHLLIIRPAGKREYAGRFLYYMLQSPQFSQFILEEQSGTTFYGISQESIENVPAFFPSEMQEQSAIAHFLDRKTAKIDDLIARKERILDLIEELKRSTQFRYITGADSPHPKRESLDSRLPSVPNLWTAEKLGYLARMVSGGTPSKENAAFWNGEIPWVSPKDMKVPYLSDSEDHITSEAVLAASLDVLPASTILIVVRGMILAHSIPVCLLLSPATINQDIKALRFSSKCNPQFMLVWLQGMAHIMHSLIEESAHGTRCLRTDLLKNVVIHLPPLDEQAGIVSALNAEIETLEKTARPITAAISLLHEYRDALISAAVPANSTSASTKNNPMPWLDRLRPNHDGPAPQRLTYSDSRII